jgi:sugar lactone lactonase YvrE
VPSARRIEADDIVPVEHAQWQENREGPQQVETVAAGAAWLRLQGAAAGAGARSEPANEAYDVARAHMIPRVAVALALVMSSQVLGVPAQRGGATGAAALRYPNGLALAADGTLYISDIGTHRVFKLSGRALTTVAGTGIPGFSGDGGPAVAAALNAPHALAADEAGRLLIADTFNHRIRRIDRTGIITTIAGTGAAAYAGDDGPASAAALNGPQDLAIDRSGQILIADTYNAVIRRIDAQGRITTFAGSEPGLGGDGGPAAKALINIPGALAIDAAGVVYISDAGNSRIRRVDLTGTIETIAGNGGGSGLGGAGFAGDGGPAKDSKAFSAMGLGLGGAGDLYVSDSGNNRVRVVRQGRMATLVGAGRTGFSGDGGRASAALLNTPQKLAVAPDGRLFIADRGNGRVRLIDKGGVISTVAGGGAPPGILTIGNVR